MTSLIRDISHLDLKHHLRDELLSHVKEVVVVGVSLVELARGELGVVGHVNPLVTELSTNLVDSLDASHDEHLEVELGGDTHEELHAEVVVVGLKGTSGGTSRDHAHHWGLHLEEPSGVEEPKSM